MTYTLSGAQSSMLRFIRRHNISAAQLFVLDRLRGDDAARAALPELAQLSATAVRSCPKLPQEAPLFAEHELATVLRLIDVSGGQTRFNAWGLMNRCVWERLFPNSFQSHVCAQILVEAGHAENISAWVERTVRPRQPHYDWCVEMLAIDVCQVTRTYSYSASEFEEFISNHTSESETAERQRPARPRQSARAGPG